MTARYDVRDLIGVLELFNIFDYRLEQSAPSYGL